LKSNCCTTLAFDPETGERVYPKIADGGSDIPSTWDEFLENYQNKQGIDACPLFDLVEGESPYLLVVCNEGEKIVCHRLPAERLSAMLESSVTASVNDPLTGALRKEHTAKEIETALSEFIRYSTPFCLMFIDLDHFKRINDTYGHLIGDQVPSDIGKKMKLALREHDSLIRYGGEEFLAVLRQATLPVSLKVAERIRHAVQSLPVQVNGHSLEITVSIGITTPETSDTILSIIGRADNAVYKAKQNGRNRIEYL